MAMRSNTNRTERVRYELKRFIALLLQTEIKDPRVNLVSITECVVSKDLKYAKIYFTVIGDKARVETALTGLNRARGFIKKRIGESLELRHTPALTFYYDSSVEYGTSIDQLLHKVSHEK